MRKKLKETLRISQVPELKRKAQKLQEEKKEIEMKFLRKQAILQSEKNLAIHELTYRIEEEKNRIRQYL